MFLVDYIPLLKHVPAWVPGASFQNVAKGCKDLCRAMIDKPFEATVQHMVRPVYVVPLNFIPHILTIRHRERPNLHF